MKSKGKKNKVSPGGRKSASAHVPASYSEHENKEVKANVETTVKQEKGRNMSPARVKQARASGERSRTAMAFSKSTVASRNKLVKRSQSSASERQDRASKPSPRKWSAVAGRGRRSAQSQSRAGTPAHGRSCTSEPNDETLSKSSHSSPACAPIKTARRRSCAKSASSASPQATKQSERKRKYRKKYPLTGPPGELTPRAQEDDDSSKSESRPARAQRWKNRIRAHACAAGSDSTRSSVGEELNEKRKIVRRKNPQVRAISEGRPRSADGLRRDNVPKMTSSSASPVIGQLERLKGAHHGRDSSRKDRVNFSDRGKRRMNQGQKQGTTDSPSPRKTEYRNSQCSTKQPCVPIPHSRQDSSKQTEKCPATINAATSVLQHSEYSSTSPDNGASVYSSSKGEVAILSGQCCNMGGSPNLQDSHQKPPPDAAVERCDMSDAPCHRNFHDKAPSSEKETGCSDQCDIGAETEPYVKGLKHQGDRTEAGDGSCRNQVQQPEKSHREHASYLGDTFGEGGAGTPCPVVPAEDAEESSLRRRGKYDDHLHSEAKGEGADTTGVAYQSALDEGGQPYGHCSHEETAPRQRHTPYSGGGVALSQSAGTESVGDPGTEVRERGHTHGTHEALKETRRARRHEHGVTMAIGGCLQTLVQYQALLSKNMQALLAELDHIGELKTSATEEAVKGSSTRAAMCQTYFPMQENVAIGCQTSDECCGHACWPSPGGFNENKCGSKVHEIIGEFERRGHSLTADRSTSGQSSCSKSQQTDDELEMEDDCAKHQSVSHDNPNSCSSNNGHEVGSESGVSLSMPTTQCLDRAAETGGGDENVQTCTVVDVPSCPLDPSPAWLKLGELHTITVRANARDSESRCSGNLHYCLPCPHDVNQISRGHNDHLASLLREMDMLRRQLMGGASFPAQGAALFQGQLINDNDMRHASDWVSFPGAVSLPPKTVGPRRLLDRCPPMNQPAPYASRRLSAAGRTIKRRRLAIKGVHTGPDTSGGRGDQLTPSPVATRPKKTEGGAWRKDRPLEKCVLMGPSSASQITASRLKHIQYFLLLVTIILQFSVQCILTYFKF